MRLDLRVTRDSDSAAFPPCWDGGGFIAGLAMDGAAEFPVLPELLFSDRSGVFKLAVWLISASTTGAARGEAGGSWGADDGVLCAKNLLLDLFPLLASKRCFLRLFHFS